jgi:hypothetical protein
VVPRQKRVVVHREPVGERYGSVIEVGPGGTLEAVALDLPPLPIADLFAAANA